MEFTPIQQMSDNDMTAVEGGDFGLIADAIAILYAGWDIYQGWNSYQPSTPYVYSTITYY